jgi:hypothetical protein
MMSWINSRHWQISTGRHFQNGHHNTAKIQHCPISSKFDMWVDNDVPNWFLSIFCHCIWNPPHGKLNPPHFYQKRVHNTIGRGVNIPWVGGRQNGRHNTAQIQHCPISTPFHMWVDYNVPNWFLISKNFYQSPFSKWPPQYCTWIRAVLWWSFWKWRQVEILRCQESIQDIIIYLHVHMKFRWNRTMLNLSSIPISTTFHM